MSSVSGSVSTLSDVEQDLDNGSASLSIANAADDRDAGSCDQPPGLRSSPTLSHAIAPPILLPGASAGAGAPVESVAAAGPAGTAQRTSSNSNNNLNNNNLNNNNLNNNINNAVGAAFLLAGAGAGSTITHATAPFTALRNASSAALTITHQAQRAPASATSDTRPHSAKPEGATPASGKKAAKAKRSPMHSMKKLLTSQKRLDLSSVPPDPNAAALSSDATSTVSASSADRTHTRRAQQLARAAVSESSASMVKPPLSPLPPLEPTTPLMRMTAEAEAAAASASTSTAASASASTAASASASTTASASTAASASVSASTSTSAAASADDVSASNESQLMTTRSNELDAPLRTRSLYCWGGTKYVLRTTNLPLLY
jgi:hypothetical protein